MRFNMWDGFNIPKQEMAPIGRLLTVTSTNRLNTANADPPCHGVAWTVMLGLLRHCGIFNIASPESL